MKRNYYIAFFFFVAAFASCKDNELFEQEMYKNEVALISSDYHNTFEEIVPLTGEEVIGYIAASAGGTHAPSKDLIIELTEDQEPLDLYNWALFDADETLYAKLLPKDKYEIESYTIRIPAGERTGRTPVKILPDGLSPDSTYFIALKASDASGIELNAKKKTILYQVVVQNDYASQADDVFYSMRGLGDGMVTAGNKKMFPLTQNSVRIVAGTENFEPNVDAINKTSIILQVNEDNSVTIKPYKDILINQLDNDPQYPNVFREETLFGRTYNVFLLSYAYTLNGVTKVMKEELRLEVTK
ncbi:BT_3044 domain-containing protein [Sphingobacterium suaedae]|uniref:BT_3044 domain-containing protein n=1 Tax=Sphingobacterium suaedae TaxID=1686402 RepID=A0ABW5KAW1_9SPHI